MRRTALAAAHLAAALLPAVLAGPAAAGDWKRLPSSPSPADTPAQRGHIVFQNRCFICHGTDPDAPGTMSLGIKYAGAKPAQLEQRKDLTPALVTYFVRHGVGMMPFFRKTEVSDADLADLGAYLSRQSPTRHKPDRP